MYSGAPHNRSSLLPPPHQRDSTLQVRCGKGGLARRMIYLCALEKGRVQVQEGAHGVKRLGRPGWCARAGHQRALQTRQRSSRVALDERWQGGRSAGGQVLVEQVHQGACLGQLVTRRTLPAHQGWSLLQTQCA